MPHDSTNHSNLLISEEPLQILPGLAAEIGVNEAIILQQLHYWLNPKRRSGEIHDGRRWVYNTYPQWQEQFPFWSLRTIQGVILKLEKEGLIESTDRFNKDVRDRTKWYTINYEHTKLCGHDANFAHSKRTQDLRTGDANFAHSNKEQRLPTETTAETTSGSPKTTRRKATQISDDFTPDESTMIWMSTEGFTIHDLNRELPKFIDYWAGTGKTMVDWQRTFKNWLRNGRDRGWNGNGKHATTKTYYKPNGGLTPEGMAAKARGEIK